MQILFYVLKVTIVHQMNLITPNTNVWNGNISWKNQEKFLRSHKYSNIDRDTKDETVEIYIYIHYTKHCSKLEYFSAHHQELDLREKAMQFVTKKVDN